MPWQGFKPILAAAPFAGLLAGLLLTGIQQLGVAPLILEAETYEIAAAESTHTHAEETGQHAHVHEHAWQPENGWERTAYTAGANVTLAIGFALLLGAAMSQRGTANWRTGLLWGLGGYAVFFAAPALGLPPEVPGTEAAPLRDRQLWWLFAVLATAGGLALLAFARSMKIKILGAALLPLPHLVGAPQPQFAGSTAPHELAQAFVVATAFANAAFWLALGGLMGLFYKKPD